MNVLDKMMLFSAVKVSFRVQAKDILIKNALSFTSALGLISTALLGPVN